MKMARNLISFDEYYREYLGLDSVNESGRVVFPTERRAGSVAYFYVHHLISTVIDRNLVHSISPMFADDFGDAIRDQQCRAVNSDLCREVDDVFFHLLPALSYSTRIMHRMTLDEQDIPEDNERFKIITLTENSKGLFMNRSLQRGRKFAEFLWEARLETVKSGRYFAIIENDEIASSSFISDIDNQSGNIVVSTQAEYRNKGYGKAVVTRVTEWCIQNNIRPIYLVDTNNTPSVRLAEGLGFVTKAREIIVSTYKDIFVLPQH
jgi:RimJ/RimL family protein N-acetyltransferase